MVGQHPSQVPTKIITERSGEFETLSHNAGEKVEEVIKWIIIDKKTNAENYRSF